jgi:hypothetical protein
MISEIEEIARGKAAVDEQQRQIRKILTTRLPKLVP